MFIHVCMFIHTNYRYPILTAKLVHLVEQGTTGRGLSRSPLSSSLFWFRFPCHVTPAAGMRNRLSREVEILAGGNVVASVTTTESNLTEKFNLSMHFCEVIKIREIK